MLGRNTNVATAGSTEYMGHSHSASAIAINVPDRKFCQVFVFVFVEKTEF